MRDLNREHEWIIEKNPPLRTYDDYREMVSRAIAAEAALAEKTEECERLQAEVVRLTIENCRLIKISMYDGLGKPELIEEMCFGYAGDTDEPHIDCQCCKAFYGREEDDE